MTSLLRKPDSPNTDPERFVFPGSMYVKWFTGYRLLIIYALLAVLVYGPLYNAGFVTDFIGWLECRDSTPFWHAYACFNNRGLYFIPFSILAFLTNSFGLFALPWFLVWTGMHAINAWLVTDVSKRLFVTFGLAIRLWMPILAGLIFMLHPWQVEVVAWKACVNYLASCMLMLLSLQQYLKYLGQGKKKFYWISVGCFVLGLFTLEFVLLFPAILAMVFWCLRVDEPVLKRSRWLCLQMIPFAVAIGVWFLANKLLFGLWIGHYGAETHTAIHPIANSATELKYLVKIFAFTRFLSFETQTQLYQILDTQVAGCTMMAIIVGLGLFLLSRVRHMSPLFRLRSVLFLAAVKCIFPVTNLYFYYLQYSENDRYTYPAIAFLAIWFVSLLGQWKGRWGKAILLAYLVACTWGTTRLVHIWELSTRAYWQHVESFPEMTTPKVFLLNVPDNFKGTFMFRNIGGDSSFGEVYKWMAKSPYSGKMYDVFQYNMTDPDNDFIVTRESESRVKVEFAQWGNWWWRNGVGGERYSNEEYTAWPEGKYYYVEFKKPLDDAKIMYHTPEGWNYVQ